MSFGVEHCKEIIVQAKNKNKELDNKIKQLKDQITDLQTKINEIKNGQEYFLNYEIIDYFEKKLKEKGIKEE